MKELKGQILQHGQSGSSERLTEKLMFIFCIKILLNKISLSLLVGLEGGLMRSEKKPNTS